MRRLTLVAILGFGILLLFGCGERQASITGVVTDSESGNPLRDAIVTLGEHAAKTGADGHYHLNKVPPGSYTLTARLEGYKPYDRSIDAQGNQEVILDITLSLLEEPTPLPIAEEGQGPHRVIERISSVVSPREGGSIVITEAGSIYSNGFTLSIPPGALEEETVITVGDVTNDFPPIPNGLRPVGLPISLEPHGLAFQIPVTVKIPYSDEMLAWAGITSPEDLLLKTYDLSTNEWTDVPIVQVDTQNGVIVTEIDHFSLFSLFSWWNRKETENPATDEQILTYINDSWGVVAAVDDLARWNSNTGILFKDEIGGILTVMAMAEQVQNEKYRKAAITGGEWLAWQALKVAGYGWLRPFALLVEATYKGGVWFVKKLDEGAFNAQICAYFYYRQEGYSVEEIKDLFVTDDGWVLTAMGTGCPPGYPRLTGRFKPEDVFRIGSLVWDAKQSGSYKQRDTESIREAFIDAIRPVAPNQPPQVRITSPSEEAIFTAGDVVNLRGTAVDPEDGPLTRSSLTWRIETAGSSTFLGEGETLSLSNLAVGFYKISLTAKDSQGKTVEDSIEITVQAAANMPPEVTIATPSDGTIFAEGDSILFTGSAIDPEDGPLADRSLVWVSGIDGVLGPGHTVTRDDLSPGAHAITLSATDSHSVFSTKTITITIESSTPNEPPIADAGADQTVHVEDTVTLDGSASYDPDNDPLTFRWTQSSGPPVTVSDPTSPTPTFKVTVAGSYPFELVVNDGTMDSTPSSAAVTVVEEPPLQNVNPEAAITPSSAQGTAPFTVRFDASGSKDSDGAIHKYNWDFGDGYGDEGKLISHTYSNGGSYIVTLTVVDEGGATDQARVTIEVSSTLSQTHAPKSYKDYHSIEAAVPGDVLLLKSGTYSLDPRGMYIDKSLTLRGAGIGKTVLKGVWINASIVISSQQPGVQVTIEDLTIKGIGPRGFAGYGNGEIRIAGNVTVRFRNVEIRDSAPVNIRGSAVCQLLSSVVSGGVLLSDSSTLFVRDSDISRGGRSSEEGYISGGGSACLWINNSRFNHAGIGLSGQAVGRISDCTIDALYQGVDIGGDVNLTMRNCTISSESSTSCVSSSHNSVLSLESCFLTGNSSRVTVSLGGASTSITDCEIDGGTAGISLLGENSVEVYQSKIFNNSEAGIRISSGQAWIENCSIFNNGEAGMLLERRARVLAVGNSIYNNTGWGLVARDSAVVAGWANVVTGNQCDLFGVPDYLINPQVHAERSSISVPQDAATVQEAVYKIEEGGVITIDSGSHEEERLAIYKSVTLQGSTQETTVLGGITFFNKVGNIVIRNVHIKGTDMDGTGVVVAPGSHLNLVDCLVSGWESALEFTAASAGDISNSSIHNNRSAINGYPTTLVINDCTICANGKDTYDTTLSLTATSLTMIGCTIKDNHGTAISLGGEDNTIKDCIVENNSQLGIDFQGGNITIENSSISHNGKTGVRGTEGSLFMQRCHILENKGNGIEWMAGQTFAINDSEIAFNTDGIVRDDSDYHKTEVTGRGNNIHDNRRNDLYPAPGSYPWPSGFGGGA
jgi:PKD repeat protein